MAAVKVAKFSEKELYALRMFRWRCRTDLRFLCNEVLNYTDVSEEVHGTLIDRLQHFPLPTKEQFVENDVWTGATWDYKPINHILDLPGKRRRLILDARGHLKTTINIQAHTIQWLLNYPNIAVAIFQSNLEKAEAILKEIKGFFQYNEKFRRAFPEHCPQSRVDDWGIKSSFTTEARPKSITRREPSITAMSVEKGTAGMHYEILKFTDIVEPDNARTKERCLDIKKAFYMTEPLLVTPGYWIDVEGTRYSFADLYGEIIEQWDKENREGRTHEYEVYCRSVFKKKTTDGKPQTFTPNELDLPELLDKDGKRQPWWPTDKNGRPRFALDALERFEARDPYIFTAQMQNNPKGGADGQEIFPLKKLQRILHKDFKSHVAIASRTMTVDTAETDGPRSNYTAIIIGAWDHHGRVYVEDIVHGKFLPAELIEKIFSTWAKYRPGRIIIEKTGFVRGLMAGIQREMAMKNLILPIELVARDTQIGKMERILNTLQPYYEKGLIRFVEPIRKDHIEAFAHMLKEMKAFPLSTTDDILDAVADLFQNKEWFGKEFARSQEIAYTQGGPGRATEEQWEKYLGTDAPWDDPEMAAGYDDRNFNYMPLP